MKKIQNHKGITLISLIAYIILTLIVLGILGTITANFRKNISGMNAQTVQDTEFDKLNLQLLRETKNEENKINEKESTDTKVVFTNGNTYTYVQDEKTVYLNDNIKIAENIESCTFQVKTLTSLNKDVVRENTSYTDKYGDVAIIPAGFAVSGKESEQTIRDGLVIYCGIEDRKQRLTAIVEILGKKRITEYVLLNNGLPDWTDGGTVADLQTTYDQFVWIPISHEQINNMYICQAKTADNGTCNITINADGKAECQTHKEIDSTKATQMAGRLYATTYGETFETGYTEVYTAGSGLREPDIVTGSAGKSYDNNTTHLTTLNTILGTSFAPTTDTTNNTGTANTDFKTYLQEEYNEIVKSVYENEGFYIGRYETSGMVNSNTNATIKVVAGSNNTTNANISNVNWYRMYAQQKKYSSNKGLTSVKSTMIQGAAYDQVMKFVENGTRPDKETYTIKTAENVAHGSSYFTKIPYQTGGRDYSTNYTEGTTPYNDCVKNIYDLEGNVRAWTTEASSTNSRVYRRR